MNTAKVASTGLVTEGYMKLINIMRFLLLIMTFVSFFINGIKKNSAEYKQLGLGATFILLGYTLFVSCDNFFFLISATLLLSFGTYRYLKILHAMYMWS